MTATKFDPPAPVLRAVMAWKDLLREALAAVMRRPVRTLLTAAGTIVGVGALVATTGLASTVQAQVGETFDARKATEVRVRDGSADGTNPFPVDTDVRLQRLNGVNYAGVFWEVGTDLQPRLLASPLPSADSTVAVIATTPGALRAVRPVLASGRLIDGFLHDRHERVAVVGSVAADQIGLVRVDNQPAVFLGDIGYIVVGIIDDVQRNPELLGSVIIPTTTADTDFPDSYQDPQVLIDVEPGAAQVIGAQAARAVRPQDPERLQVLVPPDPDTLRRSVEGDLAALFYALAGLALLVGMVGIANTTLVAVMERRGEIGIRRALGARRHHILGQFLTEAALVGAAGGILGAILGLLTIILASAYQGWTPTIEPLVPTVAPVLGAATGLLAGTPPAIRASHIQPVDALR